MRMIWISVKLLFDLLFIDCKYLLKKIEMINRIGCGICEWNAIRIWSLGFSCCWSDKNHNSENSNHQSMNIKCNNFTTIHSILYHIYYLLIYLVNCFHEQMCATNTSRYDIWSLSFFSLVLCKFCKNRCVISSRFGLHFEHTESQHRII